jgi:signal transduction histidine kinase
MVKTASVVPEEQRFILSHLAPDRAQRRLALAVVLALLAASLITAGPLSYIQPPKIVAFVPAYAAAMFVVGAITAVLLFAQFSILRSRALLVIASGFLFTAFIVIPWMLTFPGVFSPGGLLGAGLQTPVYLYAVWHAGFPGFVIAYALLKDAEPAPRLGEGSVSPAILASVAVTAGIVCVSTVLIIALDPLLPRVSDDLGNFSSLLMYAAGFVTVCSGVAAIVLWVRLRSVLELWLIVMMCAYTIEIWLITFFGTRFSLGWYGGRIFGLVSGSLVLFVLLYEITILYTQLLRSVLAERREREARLMTGDAIAAAIAHEVKQPLCGMMTNAQAGVRWLDRGIPDVDEAKAAFNDIVTAGHRATAMIENLRTTFKKGTPSRAAFDVNGLVRETLALLRADLHEQRILVHVETDAALPTVNGDRIQLQQVLLNLFKNAIDSMAAKDGSRDLTVRAASHDDGNVLVSVGDTGIGIDEQDVDRIFNPLFTTKSGGMGMGLSISRSIIEAHQGRIWVVPNDPQGAVFQFTLQCGGTASAGP